MWSNNCGLQKLLRINCFQVFTTCKPHSVRQAILPCLAKFQCLSKISANNTHLMCPVRIKLVLHGTYKNNILSSQGIMGFPGSTSGKEPICQCRRHKRFRFSPWDRNIHWRRAWQSTAVFMPGELNGQRSPVEYSP